MLFSINNRAILPFAKVSILLIALSNSFIFFVRCCLIASAIFSIYVSNIKIQ